MDDNKTGGKNAHTAHGSDGSEGTGPAKSSNVLHLHLTSYTTHTGTAGRGVREVTKGDDIMFLVISVIFVRKFKKNIEYTQSL